MAISEEELSQLLTQSPDFPGVISPPTAAEMLRRGWYGRFAAGTFITHRGQEQPRLCIVLSGAVRLTAFTPDGREMLIHLIGAGDCWGVNPCLGNYAETNDGVAETASEVLLIDAPVVRDLIWENRELQESLVGVLCTRLNLAVRVASLHGILNARQMLAWRLLMMSRSDLDDPESFRPELQMSQETLASISRLSRQRTNKILKEFEAEGVIALRYGGLTVLRPEWLHALISEVI